VVTEASSTKAVPPFPLDLRLNTVNEGGALLGVTVTLIVDDELPPKTPFALKDAPITCVPAARAAVLKLVFPVASRAIVPIGTVPS
jgi:hypothetical protein